MAELSSGKDEKKVSRTGSFNKMFGKSPSRSLSKKNSGLFKRVFSRNKSGKTNDSEGERDANNNEEEANYSSEVIENTSDVVSNIVKEEIPKVIQDNILTTIIQQAEEVVPQAIQELIQETKNVDVDPLPESTDSNPAIDDEKKPESYLNKIEEEREKINEELKEKAKECGLEEEYNASLKEKEALDAKETQERSVNINEVQERENVAEDDKQEDNCVASLAQGLQKICAQWNNNKKQD